jgi:hypothetical protein
MSESNQNPYKNLIKAILIIAGAAIVIAFLAGKFLCNSR